MLDTLEVQVVTVDSIQQLQCLNAIFKLWRARLYRKPGPLSKIMGLPATPDYLLRGPKYHLIDRVWVHAIIVGTLEVQVVEIAQIRRLPPCQALRALAAAAKGDVDRVVRNRVP